jgi:dTDP-4-amino-4,6-dideoxygalactose transaminase
VRLRRLPPVHSPLRLEALFSGARALVKPGGDMEAVLSWINATFQPRAAQLTDSGTTALTLALRAAQRIRRGPVALPAYCCYDLATAADGAGVDVLLYDIDPHTLGPDWNSFQQTIERGATAVIVAHLYGHPIDISQAQAIADRSGAVLIEDAAQGVGARFDNRPVGSFGGVAILSFGRGKGLTGGGGGALLVHADDLLPAVREAGALIETQANGGLVQLGKTAVQWALARPSLYALPASLPFLGLGETIYRRPGKARPMSRSSAAILSQAISDVPAEANRRRVNAARLAAAVVAGQSADLYKRVSLAVSGDLRLPVHAHSERLNRWRSTEAGWLGIAPGYPRALADLDGFVDRIGNRELSFSGARELSARLFTLPTHGMLWEGDLKTVESWLQMR